jgi:hypothetical protein
MDHDEQREDPRQFEKGREVREEQTRNISEEASEEDRRQWEKTRDIRKEASEIPEGTHERNERTREGQERSREERESGGPGED